MKNQISHFLKTRFLAFSSICTYESSPVRVDMTLSIKFVNRQYLEEWPVKLNNALATSFGSGVRLRDLCDDDSSSTSS